MASIFRRDVGYIMPISFGAAPELFKTIAFKEILGIIKTIIARFSK
jgi:hypothetical protein